MISPAAGKRKKLAGAAVLVFAAGGLVLSWVSAHATTLETVTISAPALKIVRRDTPTKLPLRQIKIAAHVATDPVTPMASGETKN